MKNNNIVMLYDPTMKIAMRYATQVIDKDHDLNISIESIWKCIHLLDIVSTQSLDLYYNNFIMRGELFYYEESLKEKFKKIIDQDTVNTDTIFPSILMIWAGVLSGERIIGLKILDDIITPEHRAHWCNNYETSGVLDYKLFKKGFSLAILYKKKYNEEISLEGMSNRCIQLINIV